MEAALNCARVLELLAQSKATLVARYGVTDIALFGSTVRDTARLTATLTFS